MRWRRERGEQTGGVLRHDADTSTLLETEVVEAGRHALGQVVEHVGEVAEAGRQLVRLVIDAHPVAVHDPGRSGDHGWSSVSAYVPPEVINAVSAWPFGPGGTSEQAACHTEAMAGADKWLWAVRVFKTRRQATDACTAGRIRINGEVVKPASKVKVGDVPAARRDRTIIYVAHELLEKRVSAPLAAAAVEDRSPPPPKKRDHLDLPVFAQRDRGSGRPTKRTVGRSTSCEANDAADPTAQPSANEAANRTQPSARLTSSAQPNAVQVSR